MVSKFSLYATIGGESAVYALVNEFYDQMNILPEAAGIRAMHPDDLSISRDKLAKFLCGFFGGPPLYKEHYGNPALRARHLPFSIGESERDQWLMCMRLAIEKQSYDPLVTEQLLTSFKRTADHLRNVGSSAPSASNDPASDD